MPRKTTSKTKVIYYDCETYTDRYTGDVQLNGEPHVIPYAIGCCTHEPNTYKLFKGRYCAQDFVRGLAQECQGGKNVILSGYNIDYDGQVIRPFLIAEFPQIEISYLLTDHKNFIGGRFSNKSPRMCVQLLDLGTGNKCLKLGDYYKTFQKRKETDKEGRELMEEYGVQNIEKGSIDYDKWDIDWDKEVYFHYSDAEHQHPYPIDGEREEKYLKDDVVGLPLVYFYIKDFKELVVKTLGGENGITNKQVLKATSIPSFAKVVASYVMKMSIEDDVRVEISKKEYENLVDSYFGGFTGGNKELTTVELCLFEDGTPKILSYDINSSYPGSMTTGIPIGEFLVEPPEGPFTTGYEIRFDEGFIPPPEGKKEGVIYRPKPQYDVFNNDLFGKNFYLHERPGIRSTRAFILKEMGDVYKRMCEGSLKVVGVRYQRKDMRIKEFVDKLYAIKCDKEHYSDIVIGAIKLVLNSLYGKFAERAHTHCGALIPDIDGGGKYVKQDRTGDPKFKGPNIAAGLYICSLSRAKLFNAILDEIDNGNVPLYTDTDSIKLIANNPVVLDVDPIKIGAGKDEGSFTHFFFNNKCKKYCLINDRGLNKKTGKIETRIIKKHAGLPDYKTNHFTSIEEFKSLYSPDHDYLFKNAKRTTKRNALFQTYFRNVDVRFNYEPGRDPTHVVDEKGKVSPWQK